MYPQIPENLEALAATELRALAGEIRVAVQAVNDNDDSTADDLAEAQEFVAKRQEILSMAKAKDAKAAAKAALASTEMSEEEESEAGEDSSDDLSSDGDDDETDDSAGEVDDSTEAGDDSDSGAPDEQQELEASVKPAKVRTGTGVATKVDDTRPGGFTPDKLIAKGGVSGLTGGSPIGSWLELAETLVEVGGSFSPGSTAKIPVASVFGNFDEAHTLSEKMTANLRKFEPEIMASMCAPAEPQYGLACWNTDRRPVRGSVSAYKPDARGAVTIYPSPSLADITDQSPKGVGVWDNDDDASIGGTNPSSKECAVIECAEPAVYRLYGIWRCLTVQNLLALTFPELVEAYLNRLAAAHSRLAETQLLEAMGTVATAVTADGLAYGSATSTTTAILNLLALHQEEERWDNGEMVAWIPRWFMYAMKMDIMRRRNTSGQYQPAPSDEAINTMFRNVGVDPVWFIDTPSWATAVPSVQTAGDLNSLPANVDMIVAPRGKFGVLDRGELSIGVTGNNMYRDNASNSGNQFTFFFENFEGLVDTNSCGAYLLSVDNLCHNGAQIADQALGCDGSLSS